MFQSFEASESVDIHQAGSAQRPKVSGAPSYAISGSGSRKVSLFRASDLFILVATWISFLFSVYLWFFVDQLSGVFVGIWVPSIIGVGLYFKLLTFRRQ